MSWYKNRVALPDWGDEEARKIPGLKVYNGEAYGSPDAMWALHQRKVVEVPGWCMQLGSRGAQDLELWHTPILRDYQKQAIQRMLNTIMVMGGFLLADEQGLGKTLQTLECISHLPTGTRALILAPKTALMTWEDELAKWFPKWKVLVAQRDVKTKGKFTLPGTDELNTYDVVVTNYETLSKLPEGYAPGCIVLDEVHYIKNRKAIRAKQLEVLGATAFARIGLSGTPLWSSIQDYHNVLTFLFGPIWGSRTAFGQAYAGAFINEWGGLVYTGEVTKKQMDELKGRLDFYSLRRLKVDVATELPELTRQVVWVESTPTARTYLHRLRTRGHSQTYADAIKDVGDGKMDITIDLVKQAGGRALVITYRKDHAQTLASLLNKEGVKVRLITGDTPHADRKKYIKEMENVGGSIVGTIDCLNVSLNLQKLASVGVMHSIDPIPAKILQAEARIHRLGSKDPVIWYYPAMKDSIDSILVEKALHRLSQMAGTQGKGTEGLVNALSQGTLNEDEVLQEMLKEWGEA